MTNPPKTLSIVCPAIMFANNLTDKLTGLLKYEIISITQLMVIKLQEYHLEQIYLNI